MLKIKFQFKIKLIIIKTIFVFFTLPAFAAVLTPCRQIPSPIYGVTIDSIQPLDELVNALEKLPFQPTIRLVFDPFVPPQSYKNSINLLYEHNYIMGELLDSFAEKKYSVSQYTQRVNDYFRELGSKVDIWEIGNEANGDWLGNNKDTIEKVKIAYKIITSQGGKTAITLSYSECFAERDHEMLYWANHYLPRAIKKGIDYVFVSYYPDNCPSGKPPDWNKIFGRLHKIFPHSQLGFGEIGTQFPAKKANLIHYFYGLQVDVPNYIGGYFWWYFREDMTPASKPLWQELNRAFYELHARFSSMGQQVFRFFSKSDLRKCR